MRSDDLCTLGAQTLPPQELVALVLGKTGDDDLAAAVSALALVGPPREAALRGVAGGHRLMAAVELGRRAWMLPSPAGRRMRGPVDVAAVVAPRAVDDGDDTVWTLSLDVRLTLARLERTDPAPGAVLRSALSACCRRVVVAQRRHERAVPTSADTDRALQLAGAAAIVDVALVDWVILGDDGFCSLHRLGMLPSADARYR